MSAGSPRQSRSQIRATDNCPTVSPQQVTDPTILDSVAGFINEVATYNLPCDTKDQIQWARFEQLDCDAVLEGFNGEKIIRPVLILVLAYTTGVQVWAVPANGEAVQILSWRHGQVRVLRFLPSPYVVGQSSLADIYASKRPLIALCDTTTPGTHYCALSFLSLKTGEQVKVIKFKNPILDVLANRRSVVVTFAERIAVFDAFTLEDRLTVTTCYLSPGIFPNPVTLGTRWMAYAEKKLISNKRSSGGNEGEGVQSYTATVLHAAKSLGKGLRELGETVASSLTRNAPYKSGSSPGSHGIHTTNSTENIQKGIVTILDIESQNVDASALQAECVIAHFTAHSEAIVCLTFDPSGLLLLTADKCGHDFHLFRIHPHPGGPSLAAVHHLYILHRGDTTARVQDMCFSPDSRWATVSTLRGTTHVFPVTPYGGNVGHRTHATAHVVNRLSRFHRSAGLPAEGRSNSPVSLFEAPVNSNLPYHNPRLLPYPHPTVVHPLAQIRQPLFVQVGGNCQQRPQIGRQRLNSSSEDNVQVALRVCGCFAPARAWFDNLTQPHDPNLAKHQPKPVESLFVMSCHGVLVQYDLDPHHVTSVPKEKVCDDTPIELAVHAKAQWVLQRHPNFADIPLPLTQENLQLLPHDVPLYKTSKPDHSDDRWLAQVEIVTHAGPHRRLWMGPQFTFKTFKTSSSSNMVMNEAQTVEVGRSKPVNMPMGGNYPVLIESGSVSSCEQSPKLLDACQRISVETGGPCDLQLKEELADAMLESPGNRESGARHATVSAKQPTTGVAKVVNPLGMVVTLQSDEDTDVEITEDAVIHENCDEALFRPIVTAKTASKAKISPARPVLATLSQVKTKPVKKEIEDTPVVVTAIPKNRTKLETLPSNDKQTKSDGNCKFKTTTKKLVLAEDKLIPDDVRAVAGPKMNAVSIGNVINSDVIAAKSCKDLPGVLVDFSSKNCDASKVHDKFEDARDVDILGEKFSRALVPETKPVEVQAFANPISLPMKMTTTRVTTKSAVCINVEKTSKTKPVEVQAFANPISLPITKVTTTTHKTKPENCINVEKTSKTKPVEVQAFANPISLPIAKMTTTTRKVKSENCINVEKTSNNSETNSGSKKDKAPTDNFVSLWRADVPVEKEMARPLLTDILESIDTFDFMAKPNKDHFQKSKNDEIAKHQEKFEDARDVDISESLLKPREAKKSYKPDKYQGLEPEDIVFSSEENTDDKLASRKLRKPKAKLGVRLSKNKELADQENMETPPLTAPKKSWSSIVATKTQEIPEFEKKPLLDLPEIESVENFTIDLPRKSYSTAAKVNLFEIDVNEELFLADVVAPEQKLNVYGLEKIDKSSDDEKAGSLTETTESDDSGKGLLITVAMDTEEDGCRLDASKDSLQEAGKSIRKKSKKKKR